MIESWRLLFLAAPVLIASSLISTRGEANAPQITLEVCRANVTPCQQEVSIPQDGTVDLDLVLHASLPEVDGPPLQIVGWEGRFQLGNSRAANLVSRVPSGQPVQEQGDPELALNDLVPLTASGGTNPPEMGQYFTVQNSYDPSSGQLDYAVTLLRFDPHKPQPRVPPLSNGPRHNLGRITIEGSSQGVSNIATRSSAVNPFQIVTLTPTGQLRAVSPAAPPGALAMVHAGSVTTSELSGQIGPPTADNGASTIPFPAELTISFWKVGALPPWLGGNDTPAATFRRVTTDSQGAFRVTDIAPSLLPPGVYDLRVKGRRTLGALVPGVTVPPLAAGERPGTLPVSLDGLREGDIDGNNLVDEADLLALQASFGVLEAQAEFNANADFNGDAVVDVLDFSRLAQNYGERGD